jgi:hypothetical protein
MGRAFLFEICREKGWICSFSLEFLENTSNGVLAKILSRGSERDDWT